VVVHHHLAAASNAFCHLACSMISIMIRSVARRALFL